MSERVRVQIYTAQSAGEARSLVDAGVDHVGITPSDLGLPGEVDSGTARAICEALRDTAARSVALSVETDMDRIAEMVDTVGPDVLHLCGPPGAVGPEAVASLRSRVEPVSIMQAIAVTGPDAVDVARSFAEVADFLLLDSVDPDIPGIGAAGQVHDWSLSARIVDAVEVPVILAGGLSPENVAAAIELVRPWGVDSLTHTNRPLPDGGFEKDLERVRAFVRSARGTDA